MATDGPDIQMADYRSGPREHARAKSEGGAKRREPQAQAQARRALYDALSIYLYIIVHNTRIGVASSSVLVCIYTYSTLCIA